MYSTVVQSTSFIMKHVIKVDIQNYFTVVSCLRTMDRIFMIVFKFNCIVRFHLMARSKKCVYDWKDTSVMYYHMV